MICLRFLRRSSSVPPLRFLLHRPGENFGARRCERALSLTPLGGKSGKGYTNMENEQPWERRWENQPPPTKGFAIALGVVGFVLVFDVVDDNSWVSHGWRIFMSNFRSPPKAKEALPESEDPTATEPVPKKKSGFKTRKIAEYENRIRAYSTPDKVFRYFATLKVPNSTDPQAGSTTYEILMTPEDFVRSITPGVLQPEHLGLDKFRLFDPSRQVVRQQLPEDSVFREFGGSGLISFTDYVFLLTVLSTSPRHFALAFRMFDLNGDGELDASEFAQVGTLIRSQTSVGARHRNHGNTGSTLRRSHPASGLAQFFFGPQLDQKLRVDRFLEFQARLQRDILRLEFKRRQPDDKERISELAFADMLLQHSGLNDKQRAKIRKRVKAAYPRGDEEASKGLSFHDVDAFFRLLNNIEDVDTALSFYNMAGAAVDPPTLRHVALTVAKVELSAHLINVVFTIFDENQDGELSNKEFVSVMKRRLMRGLEKPKDTGIVRLFSAVYKCSPINDQTPAHY